MTTKSDGTGAGDPLLSNQVGVSDVLRTLKRSPLLFFVLAAAIVYSVNMLALLNEPDEPQYHAEALVVANELGIRVDAFPRTAVAIFNGGTVAALAAERAGTGISPDKLIPDIVTVEPVEGTGVVEVDAIHEDPDTAALYANVTGQALAEELNRVGPGLGVFALQIRATPPTAPLEKSFLPTIVLSVVAALLLTGGFAALITVLVASRDRKAAPSAPTQPQQVGRPSVYGREPSSSQPESSIEAGRDSAQETIEPISPANEPSTPDSRDHDMSQASSTSDLEADPIEHEAPDVTPTFVPGLSDGAESEVERDTDIEASTGLAEEEVDDSNETSGMTDERPGDSVSVLEPIDSEPKSTRLEELDHPELPAATQIEPLVVFVDEVSDSPAVMVGTPPRRLVPEEDEIVQAIKGVGPAFRGRLSTAGIENLHDLASANVVWLADVTDIRRPVLSDWIEQARDLLGLSVDLSAEDA